MSGVVDAVDGVPRLGSGVGRPVEIAGRIEVDALCCQLGDDQLEVLRFVELAGEQPFVVGIRNRPGGPSGMRSSGQPRSAPTSTISSVK
jgi:hypothetical protein